MKLSMTQYLTIVFPLIATVIIVWLLFSSTLIQRDLEAYSRKFYGLRENENIIKYSSGCLLNWWSHLVQIVITDQNRLIFCKFSKAIVLFKRLIVNKDQIKNMEMIEGEFYRSVLSTKPTFWSHFERAKMRLIYLHLNDGSTVKFEIRSMDADALMEWTKKEKKKDEY